MENSDRLCSCVILNYNDFENVLKLVEKIKKYKDLDYIVIVDNKSKDDSFINLKKLSSQNVYVIQTEKNLGYGAGNNFGIRFSKKILKCDLVLIANPDVCFSNELVQGLKKNMTKTVGISSAKQLDRHGNEIKDVAWRLPNWLEYVFSGTRIIGRIINLNYNEKELRKTSEMFVDCVPGALLMIDAEKFLQVGGYDEEMFLYCEETTIGFKMKQAGYKTILNLHYTYIHKRSESIGKSIRSKRRQMEWLYNSKIIFIKKYLKKNLFFLWFSEIFFKHLLSKY
ncbi:MAG: glycosyltransferase family 2 protein [Liquorilactobacillus ghanensis]|uniref:glycosyltransferase family 2 protein n=1 Tax=Liquorilactobacillus ghanensis TaxID=399370 RepID=UPI0039ED3A4A